MINVTGNYTTETVNDTYPYLGAYDGMIVLFTSPKTGTLLKCDKVPSRIGETVDYWEEHIFKAIEGTVTISNK